MLPSLLAAVIILIGAPALAQTGEIGSGQPSVGLETSAQINRRLEDATQHIERSSQESQTSESRIGPDDLLSISVFEAPEMNCTVRVSSQGDFTIPLLGAVHAAGLTPRELEARLQSLLGSSYMKDPHVSVFVQELQSHPVSVVGSVKMPGVFQLRGTKTVIEVLSMAQGLADDAGSEVLIMRGAGFAEPASASGNQPTLVAVTPATAANEVFPSANGTSSPEPEKNTGIVHIDLKRLLDSADSAWNVPVQPGDIIKVPRAGIVYVVGEVTKPGGFVLQNNESISVLQALALAQGATHTSAVNRARIIRTDPVTGKQTEFPANLGKIFSGKAPDTFLQPKDVVFVPNSATKSVLYRGSAAALQTAAGVAIYKW